MFQPLIFLFLVHNHGFVSTQLSQQMSGQFSHRFTCYQTSILKMNPSSVYFRTASYQQGYLYNTSSQHFGTLLFDFPLHLITVIINQSQILYPFNVVNIPHINGMVVINASQFFTRFIIRYCYGIGIFGIWRRSRHMSAKTRYKTIQTKKKQIPYCILVPKLTSTPK